MTAWIDAKSRIIATRRGFANLTCVKATESKVRMDNAKKVNMYNL